MVAIASLALVFILFSIPASIVGIKLLLDGFRRPQPSVDSLAHQTGWLGISVLSAMAMTTLHCWLLDGFLRFAMEHTWQQGVSSPTMLILAVALLATLPGVAILTAGLTYRGMTVISVKLPQPTA